MTASKKRTYLALISVGAAALFVDRCVLREGAPAAASANEAKGEAEFDNEGESASAGRGGGTTQSVAAPPAKRLSANPARAPSAARGEGGLEAGSTLNPLSGSAGLPTSAETISIPELPFPRNLQPIDPSAAMRDIFARPNSAESETLAGETNGGSGSSPKAGEKRPMGREAFPAQHRLDAVMIEEEGLRIAIVNGKWLRIGDVVEGCTLLDIAGETAVFRCADGDVLLSLFARK